MAKAVQFLIDKYNFFSYEVTKTVIFKGLDGMTSGLDCFMESFGDLTNRQFLVILIPSMVRINICPDHMIKLLKRLAPHSTDVATNMKYTLFEQFIHFICADVSIDSKCHSLRSVELANK